MLQIVSDTKGLMTVSEISRAQAARDLQEYLGWPSIEELIKIVRGNEGRNIDVTVDDINGQFISMLSLLHIGKVA